MRGVAFGPKKRSGVFSPEVRITPPELDPPESFSDIDLMEAFLGLGLTLGVVIDLRLRRCSFYASRAMLFYKARSN